jgi:hypothetical protein
MRRIVIVLMVVVVFAGLIWADRAGPRVFAQDAATPAAASVHPSVGTWIADSEAGPADAPAIVVVTADGGVISTGTDGAIAGTWEATGPRTSTFLLVGVYEDEGSGGYFFIRGESEVDASGETEMTSYTWTDVAADGTVLATGQDVSRGTRLQVPPADAIESPLVGVPTWMPATTEEGTPTG